jgi:hypothetical protein
LYFVTKKVVSVMARCVFVRRFTATITQLSLGGMPVTLKGQVLFVLCDCGPKAANH